MANQTFRPFLAGVGCTLATLLALAAGLFGLSRCASRALQGSYLGPKYRDNEHYLRALHYEREQQWEAAEGEWKAFDADGWREIATRPLAENLRKQGRFAEALEVIDRNGPEVSWGEYIDVRTALLEEWKGVDAAVAWLRELDAKEPTSPFWPEELGSFHLYAGRPREALEPLLESVRRACALHGYRFDEADRLVGVPEAPAEDADLEVRKRYNNDLADLWPTLGELADAYERLGDDPNAFRWATRDVSLQQQLNDFKGYYDEKDVECGSLDGRILRARILLRRGELDAAAVELDFASHIQQSRTHETQRRLDQALARLSELRAAGK